MTRLVQNGTSREEAQSLVDRFPIQLVKESRFPWLPDLTPVDELDPQLARAIRLLQGPIPPEMLSQPPSMGRVAMQSERLPINEESSSRNTLLALSRRIDRLASLTYLLLTLEGMALICYSHFAMPSPRPFQMSSDLSLPDQESLIAAWADENLPSTTPWFISPVANHFFPVLFEPGLPLASSDEDWTWMELPAIKIKN